MVRQGGVDEGTYSCAQEDFGIVSEYPLKSSGEFIVFGNAGVFPDSCKARLIQDEYILIIDISVIFTYRIK